MAGTPSSSPVELAHSEFIPKADEDKRLNPIVFHHAINSSKELWAEVPQMIADRTKRRAYAVDMRCHGDTKGADELGSDLVVEDLHRFMKSKGIEQAILVGHCILGGSTVSLFALKYPDMVETFVNVDGAIKLDELKETLPRMVNYMQIWEEGVKQASKDDSEEEAIMSALEYTYDNFPHTEALEEKELLQKYKFPIKLTTRGYDVKQSMKAIYGFMEKASNGEEIQIPEKVSYSKPCLFMVATKADFHKGMDHPAVKALFPKLEILALDVTHNIHLADPAKFVQDFMSFYDKLINA